jgi:two-component system cell cycle sensor histidine kinase PleC
VLTLTATIAPQLGIVALTAILFFVGTGLMALALTWPPPGFAQNYDEPEALPANQPSSSPYVFTELTADRKARPTHDLAAWARLTSHMSHELRTPLNAVLGFSELMSNEVFGPMGSRFYSDYARDIHASGRMLLKSAEDALAITALLTEPERKGPPATTRMSAAIHEATVFHAHDLASRNVRLVSDLGSDDEIIAETQTTRQLLVNVLADASAFARDDATISISSQTTSGAVQLRITLASSDVKSESQEEGFALLLARTLCELSGADLARSTSANGDLEWIVLFAPATQPDLFGLSSTRKLSMAAC